MLKMTTTSNKPLENRNLKLVICKFIYIMELKRILFIVLLLSITLTATLYRIRRNGNLKIIIGGYIGTDSPNIYRHNISLPSKSLQSKILSHTGESPILFITTQFNDKRRLGNLMFNYASLIGIAKKQSMIPIVPRSMNKLYDIFNINALSEDDLSNLDISYTTFSEKGRSCKYVKEIEQLRSNTSLGDGYYQSWLYFNESRDFLRKEFHFKDKMLQLANDYKEQSDIFCEHCLHIGVHVRRGDILSKKFKRFGYTTATSEYIYKAIDYYRAEYRSLELRFVLCSDGIDWCKKYIIGNDIVYSESGNYIIDLILLSNCDHIIITTGSYGWWAAFLAGGTTIYYKDWPQPGSALFSKVNKTQYFYQAWLPMS